MYSHRNQIVTFIVTVFLNFIPYKQKRQLVDYYLYNYEVKKVKFGDMTLLAQGLVRLPISK